MIREHQIRLLSTIHSNNRGFVPGTAVRYRDIDSTYGVIVAVNNDRALVLWSQCPTLEMDIESSLAVEIAEEIDAEILRDIYNAS